MKDSRLKTALKRLWADLRPKVVEHKAPKQLESFCVRSAYCDHSSGISWMHSVRCPLRKLLKREEEQVK